MERATVRVTGVVQSVGFRPFVYRRAVDHDLRGAVRNLGDAGVRIELEGDPDAIDALLAALREEPPPLSTDRRSTSTVSTVDRGGGSSRKAARKASIAAGSPSSSIRTPASPRFRTAPRRS